jgi:hypothetical protein
MKKYLVITIDVEPDCSGDWKYSDPLLFRGVTEGVAKRLQPLFNKYHVAPTYLINNVVLEDRRSVETFCSLDGKFELGTHLHPEFIQPDRQFENYAGKKAVANCCFYPPDIEFEKIKNITSLFREVFGYNPKCFRAGRFSAGKNTLNSLSRLNYQVDSSVTPHINWNDKTRERPVDFTFAPEQPYLADEDSIILESSRGKLLEVPVSIALKRRNYFREIISSAGGLRHGFRKYKPVWIRPSFSSAEEMIYVAEQHSSAHPDRQHVVYNMMFHNVEVVPGLSPYTSSEEDCSKFMDRLEAFLLYCDKTAVKSVTLSDLYHVFSK